MAEFSDFSIKAKNFKCFGESPQGFDAIKPVNLIIGRNNSGKSSLLDMIEYATMGKIKVPESKWHAQRQPEFHCTSSLLDEHVKAIFPENMSEGGIPGHNHYSFGVTLIGSLLTWKLNAPQDQRFVTLGANPDGKYPFARVDHEKIKVGYQQRLAAQLKTPLVGKEFRRIFAERNLMPEASGVTGQSESSLNLAIDGDGRGGTHVIQSFINKAELPSELVERTMLRDLNGIFGPDAHFKDIVCQQLQDGRWEIYLEEDHKGRIPLSQSGSGLKTIILVLANIHLLPAVAKKDLSNFVFAFEELENNLHPSLLRRLLTYLRQKGLEHGCTFFLTTHSNVAIDLFNKDENAQILHVTHDGKEATVRTVVTYIDNKGILDDLDVRASDLLQSNGIIWVEGPSDRIYLNRWISLWTDDSLVEGTHYQCVFYGGRLLSHLSSEDPDTVEEAISILRVNRNAVVLMDSDKRDSEAVLNDTKRRVIDEVQAMGGMPWVTHGKEVENYIPAEAVANLLNTPNQVDQVDQYQNFFDYLDTLLDGAGKRYLSKKPLLAEQLVPNMTRNNISNVLDLEEQLNNLCSIIRSWNSMDAS